MDVVRRFALVIIASLCLGWLAIWWTGAVESPSPKESPASAVQQGELYVIGHEGTVHRIINAEGYRQ